MRGPATFPLNETAGLLTMGFDRPPTVMMPYNPEYYDDLVVNAGFEDAQSLIAYYLDNSIPPEKLVKLEKRLAQRLNVGLRTRWKDDFAAELERVLLSTTGPGRRTGASFR